MMFSDDKKEAVFKENLKEVIDFYDFKKSRNQETTTKQCLMAIDNQTIKQFIQDLQKASHDYTNKEEFLQDIKKILEME